MTDATTATTETVTTAAADWKDGLPEDLKGNATLATVKDVPALAKAFVDTKAMVGRKFDLSLPDVRKAVGVPDNPEAYTLDVAEDLQPFLTPESAKALAPAFHRIGLTGAQGKALVGELAQHLKASREALTAEWKKEHDQWKATVGEAKYGEQIAVGDMLTNADTDLGRKFDPDGSARAVLESTGLLHHPAVAKLFAAIGAEFREQASIQADLVTGGKMTPEEAKAEYADIMNNPKNARHDAFHRGDKEAHAYVDRLYVRAYGQKSVDFSPSVWSTGPRE